MKKKMVGLIECSNQGEVLLLNPVNENQGYQLRKILLFDKSAAWIAKAKYPEAEIVESIEAILEDETIEHIIISDPASREDIIGHVLNAGKSVQVF